MLKNDIVFIVGAGASNEVNLPLGLDLMKSIGKSFELNYSTGRASLNDDEIAEAVREHAKQLKYDIPAYDSAVKIISKSSLLGASIDNLINTYKSNPLVGELAKIGIAKHILKSETDSDLFLSHPANHFKSKVLDSWYFKIFSMLHTDIVKENVSAIFEKIKFITFNYDRCIEHFFFHAIKNYFSLDEQETINVMKKLTVEHVYGSLGKLEYSNSQTNFGQKKNLLSVAAGLQTFTEGQLDTEKHQRIINLINNSERLVFLGFSFENQALNAIAPFPSEKQKIVYTTAYNMSEDDIDNVEGAILQKIGSINSIVKANSLKARQFLDYYSRSIQFG